MTNGVLQIGVLAATAPHPTAAGLTLGQGASTLAEGHVQSRPVAEPIDSAIGNRLRSVRPGDRLITAKPPARGQAGRGQRVSPPVGLRISTSTRVPLGRGGYFRLVIIRVMRLRSRGAGIDAIQGPCAGLLLVLQCGGLGRAEGRCRRERRAQCPRRVVRLPWRHSIVALHAASPGRRILTQVGRPQDRWWRSTGRALNRTMRVARPRSSNPSVTPSSASERRARTRLSARNEGVAFAIASTPVRAEQPLAKAASSSPIPTAPTVRACVVGGSGWIDAPRTRPTTTTVASASTNTSLGR